MKAARTRALNRKHAGTAKHGSTAKHTGSATRHATTAHKQVARRAAAQVKAAHLRAWSPDEDWPMCSARAVAESLRLALGVPVSHDDVLALYWLAADDPDAGASILATLEASGQVFGQGRQAGGPSYDPLPCAAGYESPARLDAPLPVVHDPIILGLDLPWGEPHAVVAHAGAWWSWGQPYDPADFPGAVIEEAWAVTWA